MNKLAFLLVLLLFSGSVFSQTDSAYVRPTTQETIKKGRNNLINYAQKADYATMQTALKIMFRGVDRAEYVTLFPEEAWLVYLFVNDYNAVLNELEKVNIHFVDELNKLKWPEDDKLYSTLQSQALIDKTKLINKLNSAKIKQEQKEILILCLNNLTANEEGNDTIQVEINKQASLFLENYNDSKYDYYVRNFVRYEYNVSSLGWGVEFYSGIGLYNKELKNSFTNHWAFGFAFDVYYKRLNLHLSQYIATSKTKQTLNYDNTEWNEGSKASTFLPEISVGYLAYQNKVIKLRPTAGFGYLNISPTAAEQEKDPLLRSFGLSSTTYSLGLTCDIIISPDAVQMLSSDGIESNAWYVRLRYNYYIPQYTKEYPELTGNFHSLTIGIGGFARSVKRLY